MSSKFQIKSRAWNIGVLVGSIVLVLVGFGGLFFLRGSPDGSPGATTLFISLLGIVTFLLFAGPGIVYSARKRLKPVKDALPGGTMAWVRSHLYIPILALVAAYVHATAAPFRGVLSSGKVTLVLGVLVAISGLFRHHLIGIQKEALNVNVAIGKLTTGQPRAFRSLVTDLTDARRPLPEIEADVAQLDPPLQERWARIRQLSDNVDKHFPRTGGQRPHIRHYKLWRAIHPPLTIALFLVLAFHVWDVFGTSDKVFGDEKDQFASAQECAACHSDVVREWASSSMAHAQTSTITEAQLPITLTENRQLADDIGGIQEDRFEAASKSCINCHAQVGARFAENIDALFPLDGERTEGDGQEGRAVSGGGDAVQSDGVGCIVCHSQGSAPPELAAVGELEIPSGSSADFGDQYGPLLEDPGPLPVRVHGMGAGDDDMWDDTVQVSQMCGACHNVKVDMDDDGTSDFEDAEEGLEDDDALVDSDGDFQLDQNELDDNDGEPGIDDLALQTTFDEWQDYVAGFEARFADDPAQTLDQPLGCVECHMPSEGDGTRGLVDHAPGVLPTPDRQYRSHSFVGVDYDLDPEAYEGHGLPDDALERVLEEREALLQSAVTLEVVDEGTVQGDEFVSEVRVTNNLLAHAFPTGFAFARQFWLEVTAETASGDEVCLVEPADGVATPCGSGIVDDVDEDLRQCDLASISDAVGTAPEDLLNGNITFAPDGGSFPADDCDPWLTNFQKILTDGDPDGDGLLQEVPYQPFLPNVVQFRGRVATQLPMNELQPVRLRCVPADQAQTDEGPCDLGDGTQGVFSEDQTGVYGYVFDTSGIADGEEITVTARLRFRHLPPYFVRDLQARQEELADAVPDDVRIDADELLEQMVITDVVETTSNEGPELACEGPQNEEGASILDCLEGGETQDALPVPAGDEAPTSEASLLPWGSPVLGVAAAMALWRRRRPPVR